MEKKLRIVSDGTLLGSKIYYGDELLTDHEIVTDVKISIDADFPLVKAEITLLNIPFEVDVPIDQITLRELIPDAEEDP